jgi:hypothetical protein
MSIRIATATIYLIANAVLAHMDMSMPAMGMRGGKA